MIVPSMPPEQVYDEMCEDFEGVMRHAYSHGRVAQKEMFRKGIDHQTIHIKHLTKSRNDWHILIRIYPTLIVNKPYIINEDKYGKVVYMLPINEDRQLSGLLKFNTHFFSRYRERQPVPNLSPPDLIKKFLKANWGHEPGTQKTEDPNIFLAHYVFPEGIGLGWGELNKFTITMKTYLPNHMLNDKQKSISDYIRGTDDAAEFSKQKMEEYKQGLFRWGSETKEF